MTGETFESGAPSADEVNDSDFEVSDVEGDMTEKERATKRKNKIKKKMNERVEKKALALFNERMKLENKKNQQEFHTMSHTYETSNFQSSNLSFSTVSMGKPPDFDGTDYARWSEDMQVHLYGLNPHLWTIVCRCASTWKRRSGYCGT